MNEERKAFEKLLKTLQDGLEQEESKLISILDGVYYPVSPNSYEFMNSKEPKYKIGNLAYIIDDNFLIKKIDVFDKKYIIKSFNFYCKCIEETKSYISQIKNDLHQLSLDKS